MAKKINAYAITGNITRTFYTCEVRAYRVTGIDKNTGLPTCEEVVSDSYVTVNPNDKAQVKRIVREIGGILDTARVVIIDETLYSMSLDDFYCNANVVTK